MCLVHIRQQSHSIHVFDGIIEIIRVVDHVVVMTRVEDGKLLKLKGTSSNSQNYANLAQHSGNLSSILLCHAQFGHINYDSLKLMKRKGIQGLGLQFQDNFPNVILVFQESMVSNLFMTLCLKLLESLALFTQICVDPCPFLQQMTINIQQFIDDYTRM